MIPKSGCRFSEKFMPKQVSNARGGVKGRAANAKRTGSLLVLFEGAEENA
jgi:hypothetical protein